jgi:hypothetical protein
MPPSARTPDQVAGGRFTYPLEFLLPLRRSTLGGQADRLAWNGAGFTGPGDLRPGEAVIEIRRKTSRRLPDGKTLEFSRTLQMQRSQLDRYLIELLEMATWAEGIRYLLADHRIDGKPWPHYRNEDRTWL